MSSVLRVLLFWLLLAPLLFTVIAEVLLVPTGLVARLFYDPTDQPAWLQAILFAVGAAAYVTSGSFVWWCWRRFRIPNDASSGARDSAA